MGVLAGTIGILQANEAVKEILEIGDTLADRLLIYDALEMKFRSVGRPKDPRCPHSAAPTRRSPRWKNITSRAACNDNGSNPAYIVLGPVSGKPRTR